MQAKLFLTGVPILTLAMELFTQLRVPFSQGEFFLFFVGGGEYRAPRERENLRKYLVHPCRSIDRVGVLRKIEVKQAPSVSSTVCVVDIIICIPGVIIMILFAS